MHGLNNQYAEELSFLDFSAFTALLKNAAHVRCLNAGQAFIVALHESNHYDNPNFFWFKQKYERFYYVDRVAVGKSLRGQGAARKLYFDLEQSARAEGRERLVCEINAEPPNPASDGFHLALGFAPFGEQYLADRQKLVRYWAKELR